MCGVAWCDAKLFVYLAANDVDAVGGLIEN
jgi:hypothetical protein